MSKTATETVLVTGATGNTGSALLRLLDERGVAVRAMVRDDRAAAKLPKLRRRLFLATSTIPPR